MSAFLHLSGPVVRQNAETLRQILLDHTRCERSTDHILRELRSVDGTVSHCVVHPATPAEGADGGLPWRVRIVVEEYRGTALAV
jgi:hypothetical protein